MLRSPSLCCSFYHFCKIISFCSITLHPLVKWLPLFSLHHFSPFHYPHCPLCLPTFIVGPSIIHIVLFISLFNKETIPHLKLLSGPSSLSSSSESCSSDSLTPQSSLRFLVIGILVPAMLELEGNSPLWPHIRKRIHSGFIAKETS